MICLRRFLAFVLDLIVVFVIVLGIGSIISRYGLAEAGPLTAFAVLWACFFYFAIFNWRPGRTLGKYAFSLELLNLRQERPGVFKSISRTFVGLLLPIFVADWIDQQMPAEPSKYEWIALFTLMIAVLSIISVSIVVGKGTTGCHDLLFGCGVFPARRTGPVEIGGRHIMRYLGSAVLISLLIGAVTAIALYAGGLGQLFVKPAHRKDLPEILTFGTTVKEQCDIFSQHVGEGLNDPSSYIRRTSCYVMPNDFEIGSKPFLVDSSLPQMLKKQENIFVFEVTFSPTLNYPTLVRGQILANFANVAGQVVPDADRPVFLGLRFRTEDRYGLFDLASLETLLLFVAPPQDNIPPTLHYLSPDQSREASLFFLDLQNIRQIMLGNLRPQDWRRGR